MRQQELFKRLSKIWKKYIKKLDIEEDIDEKKIKSLKDILLITEKAMIEVKKEKKNIDYKKLTPDQVMILKRLIKEYYDNQ